MRDWEGGGGGRRREEGEEEERIEGRREEGRNEIKEGQMDRQTDGRRKH